MIKLLWDIWCINCVIARLDVSIVLKLCWSFVQLNFRFIWDLSFKGKYSSKIFLGLYVRSILTSFCMKGVHDLQVKLFFTP